MGNFTKKPIKSYKYNNITVREYKDSRISDKIRLYIVVFIISLIVIVWVTNASYNQSKWICNSKKCEERVERIVSCERFTKSKEKIIECASWKTIFMRKQVTRFERAEIENEVKDLYEKIHNDDLEVYHKKWDKKDHKQEILNKFIQEWKKQGMTYDNKDHKENLKDMLGTFLWENGNMNMQLRSYVVWSNGYYDYGLCQVNKWYHPKIVNDKRFFTDIDFQIENCVKLYRWGTKFYWARHKEKMKKNLVFNK